MRDIATALASDTSMIDDDVDCIFNLEKDLAEVNLLVSIDLYIFMWYIFCSIIENQKDSLLGDSYVQQ
jgi:hypothetical protein